ncbi:MAG: 50S ribosomal protein L29 [Promethearchaeota archaeon]
MDIITANKVREMDERERERSLITLREELMMLFSQQTGGGIADNPAKAKLLRKQIARILTDHDLIGFRVQTKLKSKPTHSKFMDAGVVIDDTQNMLISEKKKEIKKYIKKDYIFRFTLDDGMLEVNGSKIVGIPENRLRSLKKKKWSRK